jgi:hypothetical protein
MKCLACSTVVALLGLCFASVAGRSQAPALAQLPVGVHAVLPPTPPSLDSLGLRVNAATDRERRGTFAGIGMLLGFVAGAAYGNAHTSPSPARLFLVMAYGCGGMVIGAVGGAVLYQVVEGSRH